MLNEVLRKRKKLFSNTRRSFFWLGLGLNFVWEFVLASNVLSTTIDPGTTTLEPIGIFRPAKLLVHNLESKVNENTSLNLWQQLNLSPQQKHQIKQISVRYQKQISQLKQELKLAQQQLARMMVGRETVETIRFKHQYVSLLRQQLATLHFESILETREVLNLQQRQKFADIIQAER